MEICNEDRFTPRNKMDKKSSKMESRPQHWSQSKQVGRPRKRWEDDINQVLKSEETEKTKENDMKTNDAWIWPAKDKKRWKDMEEDYIKRQLTPQLS